MNEFKELSNESADLYIAAYCFITTTITTVGYGEIIPKENLEIIFVMILELIGLAAFSFILGTLTSIRIANSVGKIVQSKTEGVKEFLDHTVNIIKDKELPNEIYTNSTDNVKLIYNYGIRYIFNLNNFYEQLKPSLRREISF